MDAPEGVPSHDSSFRVWRARGTDVLLNRPIVVGILNLTPDSFSDGGTNAGVDAALRRVDEMLAEGADVIDVGGESTRPGAQRVSEASELERVLPVLRALRPRCSAIISVDTTRGAVARAALAEGVDALNDVAALRLDPTIADAAAMTGAGLILMHSRGGVTEMASYEHATYSEDVVADVVRELSASVDMAIRAGVSAACVVLDPGIGFSKRTEHSVQVLAGLDRLVGLGLPIMVGASRKRVIGDLTGVKDPRDRRDGTIGAHVASLAKGAMLFRVHDVRAHRHALDVAWRILQDAL